MLLFFDVETTGKWRDGLDVAHPAQPKLVQLAARLLDYNGDVKGEMNMIVKPDDWVIPIEASSVHGILHQQAVDNGVPLLDVMRKFDELIKQATKVIGYNVVFDISVIKHALKLLRRTTPIPTDQVCVMMMATEYLKIPHANGNGYRWPKLTEAYENVCKKQMVNAHDALGDVEATVELFKELKRRGASEQKPVERRNSMPATEWASAVPGRSFEDLQAILETAEFNESRLSNWERRQFIPDLRERLDKYRENIRLSDKQWLVIERIRDRVG